MNPVGIQTILENFLKNKRDSEKDIPSIMNWNDKFTVNGTQIGKLFASFFQSM